MVMTEEQRKRAEANRLAALAKRKALTESTSNQQQQQQQERQDAWKLFKCQKSTSVNDTHLTKRLPNASLELECKIQSPEKFRVMLEVCSPDSFSVTPVAVRGFTYPGEVECLRRLNDILSDVIPSHYTQNYGGGKACVYKLVDYSSILACLKKSKGIEVGEVPWVTFSVVEKLSHSFVSGRWEPCRAEHFSDELVEQLIEKLPKKLLDTLLPFQHDGLRFCLRRGGRCLIADEMGLGKTLQAIAIAGCFMNEGSVLVVCPAILRYSWAEELERWLPNCLPSDIHLVFGHQNNPDHLTRCPKVVVISYTMLRHLQKSMLEREWALLIVDESHHLRCSKKKSESEETKTVLNLAEKVKRIVLLSGTPSLSRPYDMFHQINMLWPGLLGKEKFDFAKTYCDVKYIKGSQGKFFQDFSKGIRLEELNVLLRQTVMIRRLKEHVLVQLPPKRRQIIRVLLKRSDITSAKADVNVNDDATEQNSDEPDSGKKLTQQELGIAKLSGFREWLSLQPVVAEIDGAVELDLNSSSCKMIIFAHHIKVLDGIQEFICEKGIGFVRIDGNTLERDRQKAVLAFKSSNEVKIAIIGITAGGVGLDFSSAQNVVFLELPPSSALMLQAEDRAHRRGQLNAVNIYIFCAKDTIDESHWKYLNRSLRHVSSATNGKYDAVHEIEVEGVSYIETHNEIYENQVLEKAAFSKLSEDSLNLQDSESTTKVTDICKEDIVSELEIAKGDPSEENMGSDGFLAENLHPDLRLSTKLDEECERNQQPEIIQAKSIKMDDDDPVPPFEADSSQIDSLRFEMSQYTGRVHLYCCTPGTDSRPMPLYENFRSEEVELENSNFLKDNPTYRHAILAFISQWNKLRAIEKKKLLGKPLQLPLSLELCYLSESNSHNTGGLLKGRSNRRNTPLYEISLPLPSDSVWKTVCLRSGYNRKEKEYTQGLSSTGEPLCKLCQKTCTGRSANEPEYFEDLFCNLACFEEYRLRTSSGFLRQELFQLEHGICTKCQLNCHQLVKHIKPLSLNRRRDYVEKVAPQLASRKSLLDKLINDPTEGNAWHADHIVPVYLGGGECTLENLRTLCVACHSDVTAAQCAQRKSTRIEAKKQLKGIMNNLKNISNTEKTNDLKDVGCSKGADDLLDDELLVTVPGSSYAR